MQLYLENLTFRACFFRFHLNLINQEEWQEKKELLFSNIEKKESKIKSQLYNEFKKGNLNIKNKHFDYAFNNPKEFIAVAAEGDIRKGYVTTNS